MEDSHDRAGVTHDDGRVGQVFMPFALLQAIQGSASEPVCADRFFGPTGTVRRSILENQLQILITETSLLRSPPCML